MPNVQVESSLHTIQQHVGKNVVGLDVAVERLLVAALNGGHVLLQGMPGVAKTLLVNTLARAIDLRFGRVQFTIDLLPADIVGGEVLNPATGTFEVTKGPIFTNFLLADEINRAAPKVQSALLEAMQERQVTIGGESFSLPIPFLVVATQNPVELSGTFELPEAQLDRFMFRHEIGYPSPSVEEDIVQRSLGMGLREEEEGTVPMTAFDAVKNSRPIVDRSDLRELTAGVKRVEVSPILIKHAVDIIQRTRRSLDLEIGCSPRASVALTEGARARAYLHGRAYAIPDDLFSLVEDVVLHRIRPTHEALVEGRDARSILHGILQDFMAAAGGSV